MSNPTLLTISGSLRKGSYNRMLLTHAAAAFGEATVVDADLNLPLYDGDVEANEGIPAAVQTLVDQITQADAIVIAAPEYNKSISGVLKNAIDWVSRVPDGVLAQKPVVVLSAAAGRTGGETAQFVTMQVLLQLQAHIIPGPAVLVAAAMNEFDAEGNLPNEHYQKAIAGKMQALRAAIE
ncbi:FMN-dependent NADPH-azoreductase [Roseovarius albus]|uniref:FMN-dependent NADPH-azoreductase n=1 Tax=Roseovarius albus TaxID=1247867 RepID=A0A1X6ZLK7_9RHOB|nr:NAD(P)H-dependent oxidoreductase [Roseovarius albus]SLN52955.1 FMN-dependent NADPH-azoreductase [Roseovarius albus]